MKENSNLQIDKAQITQQKILDAATQVFSEKGFYGARVDEIAVRAGVNKAMLYYYFKNKEKLFEELIKRYREESSKIIGNLVNNTDWNDEGQADKFYEDLFDYLETKKDILRIIIIEALKTSSSDDTIFNILLPSLEFNLSKLQDKTIIIDDSIGFMLYSFFFSMVPGSVFLALGDRWADFYAFDREKTKKRFKEVFRQFRKTYYKSVIREK